jgi:hypothetical protein
MRLSLREATSNPIAPHWARPDGGVRDSGWGRTGPESLADFSDLIWITPGQPSTSIRFELQLLDPYDTKVSG